MTDAGFRKITEAKENGQWKTAVRSESIDFMPEELENTLKGEKEALSAFQDLPASTKKRCIYWVEDARKDFTRQRRIQKTFDEVLKNNKRKTGS